MLVCSKCNQEINDNAKFCSNCGTPVRENHNEEKRKMVFEGTIHKCPNCGEILKSFVTNCPSCGYELRNIKSSESLKELTYSLSEMKDEKQQELLIKNYPIPNTKEDIMEFLILAKSNIEKKSSNLIYEAWNAKLEQIYEKAKMLFNHDEQFLEVEKLYSDAKQSVKTQKVSNFWINNMLSLIGILTMIFAIIIEKCGGNAALVEMISYIVIICGAALLHRKKAEIKEYGLTALIGIAVILLSFLFENGSVGELAGAIVLIIVVVNFFRFFKNR